MPKLTVKCGTTKVTKDIQNKNLLAEIRNLIPELPQGFSKDDVKIIVGGVLVDLDEFCINREFSCDVDLLISTKGIIQDIFENTVAGFLFSSLQPELPTTSTGAKESPNNSFFGQENTIRLYDLIPNAYGEQVSYPDLAVREGGAWEYVNNQKIVKEVFIIGTGEYEKEEPKYELTPLTSIQGSTYQYYEPFQTIPVVQGQFNAEAIDGQVLLGPNNEEVTPGIVEEQDPPQGGPVYIPSTNLLSVDLFGTQNVIDLKAKYDSGEPLFIEFDYDVYIDTGAVCEKQRKTAKGLVLQFSKLLPVGYNLRVDFTDGVVNTCTDPIEGSFGPYFKLTELEGAAVTVTVPVASDEMQFSFDFRNGLRGSARIAVFVAYAPLTGGIDRFFYEYSGNTSNQKFFTEKESVNSLPGIPQRVTLVRLNDDKDNNTDRVQVSQVATNAYRYNVNYGNNTILTTERKANEQALKVQKSKINAKVTRKTVSYDLNTGQVITNLNASRSFADAILHEYTQVQGLPASDLPLDELYTIKDSIPVGLGNFDYTFSDKESSIKSRIDTIANVARCIMPYTGQGYKIFRDGQRYPVAQFDSRNIDLGSPEEVSYRGVSPTSNDGVKLEWRNPDGNKLEDVYYVIQSGASVKCVSQGGGLYIPAKPTRPYEIKLKGCMTLEQAEDRADVECRKLIFIQKTLSIVTLVDGENVERGQVVKHVDYWTDDIASGEIKSINGNVYESHNELKVPIGSYYITYTDEYGSVSIPSPVTVIDDTTFSASMPDAYLADGYLVQCGTRFMISTIEEHETSLYVVNDKKSDSSGRVQLELVQYDERVYPELD